MSSPDRTDARVDATSEPIGKAALIASVGGQRGYADWANPEHRLRRLLAEFIGVAGLTFILSGGAAIPVRYGGHGHIVMALVLVGIGSGANDGSSERQLSPPRCCQRQWRWAR